MMVAAVGAEPMSKPRLMILLRQCVATSAAVLVAWLCCLAGRAASEAVGAPGFDLALVAVVADAVGSALQQAHLGGHVVPLRKVHALASRWKRYEEAALAGATTRNLSKKDSRSVHAAICSAASHL